MPKKILLADDSITIQKVVELTFSDGDYEVTAVNNGARAIQKLADMRPDIILSDIIMPEKNGYEVCEYVKSHPEYRNIPVVLLTGTFEPFDPDRADKAGCDAVVTKPFESQSLIHKVEELIEQARANAPAPAPASAPAVTAPTPAATPTPAPPPPAAAAPEASPWSDEAPAPPAAPSAADIFSSPSRPSGPTTEMPFGQSSPATTQQFTPPSAPDDSPWGAPPMGGETRAFPKMSFEEMKRMADEKPPEPAPADDSPFGAPPDAEQFSGETRAFPKMNFDDLQKAPEPPPPVGEPEESEGPAWSMTPEPPAVAEEEPAPVSSMPFGAPEPAETQAEEPAWALSASTPASTPAADASSGNGTIDLSEEQIDRIARRVVQLMSDQVIRNIAWEVIPDTAEMIVKERIRQLESES